MGLFSGGVIGAGAAAPATYDDLVDALGAAVVAHYKLAEASGATAAARVGGPALALANTAAIAYREGPLVERDPGGRSMALLAGAAPGHATAAAPLRSAAFTLDVALQLRHGAKHIVATAGDGLPGGFSVEVIDDGQGGLRPRVWSIAEPAPGVLDYVVYHGAAGTVPVGAGCKLTYVRAADGAQRVYVDGAEVALTLAGGAPPGAWPAVPAATWYFGAWSNGRTAPLHGCIDELVLAAAALSAGQVGTLALARSNDWAPPSQTGLNVDGAPYNAAGDGATDDRAAIQACFNDAVAQGTNVIFGAGKTYLVGAALSLTDFNGTVYGNGATIMASGAMGAGAGPNLTITRGIGYTIDTLHLDGRRDLRGSVEAFGGHLVQVRGGSNGTFRDCNLKRAPTDNLRFAGVNQSNNATFPVNFTVSGGVNEDAGRLGVAVIEAFGGLIDGVTFRDIARTTGYAPGCGIDLEPNSTSHVTVGEPQAVRDIEVRNCTIEDCWGGGIHVTSANNTVPTPNNTNIHHNTIRRCGGRVLSHGGNSYPPNTPFSRVSAVWSNGRLTYIQDNTIEADQIHVESDHYGAIALGIDMQGVQHVDRNTITLADIYDGNGIYVHGPSSGGLRSNGTGSTVTDNTITTGAATDGGIAKGRTSGWSYSGNVVDGVTID